MELVMVLDDIGVDQGWLNDGVGDGSWISFRPILAHNDCESTEDVVLGLDGMTLHASPGAEIEVAIVGCDHQFAPAGELGNKGGGRTMSTIRGGGGNKGRKSPIMLCFTSSLFPHRSSPAPSSSSPSRAETCVRYTNLLMA